ncbi:MAG: hypothetical protein HQL64_17185, partial [Magnetococcales bacterium]|nr:hypothetical protein [Magnetococcales bacterium]
MSFNIPGLEETLNKAYDSAMAKEAERQRQEEEKSRLIGARADWYTQEAERRGRIMPGMEATMNAAYDYAMGENPDGSPHFFSGQPGNAPVTAPAPGDGGPVPPGAVTNLGGSSPRFQVGSAMSG